jgi:hypothetical protein
MNTEISGASIEVEEFTIKGLKVIFKEAPNVQNIKPSQQELIKLYEDADDDGNLTPEHFSRIIDGIISLIIKKLTHEH